MYVVVRVSTSNILKYSKKVHNDEQVGVAWRAALGGVINHAAGPPRDECQAKHHCDRCHPRAAREYQRLLTSPVQGFPYSFTCVFDEEIHTFNLNLLRKDAK